MTTENPFDDAGDGFEDDGPWADPAIRAEYEAALGRLILAFNEVDFQLTAVIKLAVEKLDGAEALRELASGRFYQRMANLKMLQALSNELHLSKINDAKLLELNEFRNTVAHGHFDQNLADGSYVLLESERGYKEQRAKMRQDFPATRLDEISEEMRQQAYALRGVQAVYAFSHVVLLQTEGVIDGVPKKTPG